MNPDLQLKNYDYHLPEELIAHRLAAKRESARLLVYDQVCDQVIHSTFAELAQFLEPNTTLFFNQSKVFPCRLRAQKTSGAQVEIFVLSVVGQIRDDLMLFPCLLKSSGKKRLGEILLLPDSTEAQICQIDQEKAVFYLSFSCGDLLSYLHLHAQMPIPPYIRQGHSDEQDKADYQTCFASDEQTGSVAAPTAGLHFSPELLKNLVDHGHKEEFLTLHVGLGTFSPVKVDNILEHQMHEESFCLDQQAWSALQAPTPKVAVGTTSLRAMESAIRMEQFEVQKQYSTDIFLYPGQKVQSITGLITNFHLPKSTLLMLVSSLIGREKTLELYEIAVKEKYKFFSYGDGMFIKRKPLEHS